MSSSKRSKTKITDDIMWNKKTKQNKTGAKIAQIVIEGEKIVHKQKQCLKKIKETIFLLKK